MLDVDLIGISAVSSVIKQSDLPRFIILRRGAGRGATPIYEALKSDSSEKAKRDFEQWANTLLAANPNNNVQYELIAFDDTALDEEDFASDGKMKRSRSKRIRFSFMLKAPSDNLGVINGKPEVIQPDMSSFVPRSEVDKMITDAVEKTLLKIQIKRLEDKINELEEEDEEEDEEEIGGVGGSAMAFLDKLGALMNAKKPEEAAINGIEGENTKEAKIKRLNEAIKTLAKHDKDIDKSLAKLAEIAETKPDTFQQLLSMLQMY